MKFFTKLLRDEQGATAIEYGLIAALIAVAAITAMSGLGDQLDATFTEVCESMGDGVEAEGGTRADCAPAPAGG